MSRKKLLQESFLLEDVVPFRYKEILDLGIGTNENSSRETIKPHSRKQAMETQDKMYITA